MKRKKALAACLLLCSLGLAAPSRQGDPPSFQLAGVSAKSKVGTLEVRLIWVPMKGWLPDGGINVYRVQDGHERKLNASPIQPQAGVLKPEVVTKIKTSAVSDKRSFATAPLPIVSSKQAFADLKTTAVKLKTEGATSGMMHSLLRSSPAMQNHLTRLVAPKANFIAPPKAPATPEQVRASLIFQTLAHPSLSSAMGISFTDSSPVQGQITYEIKGISSGSEQLLATAVVSVDPKDTSPPSPPEMDALQAGQHLAQLHWEPADLGVPGKLGLATYLVERVDAKNPTGTPVSTDPVVITYEKTSDGKQIPSPVTFSDGKAPTGPISYRVTTIDSFGRQSAPSVAQVLMEDIRTPLPFDSIAVRRVLTNRTAVMGGGLPAVFGVKGYALTAGIRNLAEMDGQILHLGFKIFRHIESTSSGKAGAPAAVADSGVALQATAASTSDMTVGDLRKLYGDRALSDALTKGKFQLPKEKLDSSADVTLENFKQQFSTNFVPIELRQGISVGPTIDALVGPVVEFTDSNIPTDAYLVYTASDYFEEVKRDSLKISSRGLASPLTTKPATPGGLQIAKPVSALMKGQPGFYHADKNMPVSEETALYKGGRAQAKELSVKKRLWGNGKTAYTKGLVDLSHFKNVSPAKIAYDVTVSWQPVNQTVGMRYSVYRAIASGLAKVFSEKEMPIPGSKVGGYRVYGSMQYLLDIPNIPPSNWVLLGQTTDTKWVDEIQKSHELRYAYKVSATNRWGVVSDLTSESRVTIPASMPPSVPSLKDISSPVTGGVSLTWTPNPPEEQVTTYVVLRRPVDPLWDLKPSGKNGDVSSSSATAPSQADGARGRFSAVQFKELQLTLAKGGHAESTRQSMQKFSIPPRASMVSGLSKAIAAMGSRTLTANAPVTAGINKTMVGLLDLGSYRPVATVTINPADVSKTSVSYLDQTGVPKVEYLYRLQAINSDSIGSEGSTPMDASAYRSNADPVTNLSAIYSPSGPRCVQLKWSAPASGAAGYIIKRLQATGPNTWQADSDALVIGVLDQSSGSLPTKFQDVYIRTGQNYRYEVYVLDSSGNLSLHGIAPLNGVQPNPTKESGTIPPAVQG